MALPSFCDETVTVWRAPWGECRGARVRDWERAEEREVGGCCAQFSASSLDRSDLRAQAVSDEARLFAPPGADIEADDRVECSLGSFRVDGTPMERRSPTGAVSHVECRLARWEG